MVWSGRVKLRASECVDILAGRRGRRWSRDRRASDDEVSAVTTSRTVVVASSCALTPPPGLHIYTRYIHTIYSPVKLWFHVGMLAITAACCMQ